MAALRRHGGGGQGPVAGKPGPAALPGPALPQQGQPRHSPGKHRCLGFSFRFGFQPHAEANGSSYIWTILPHSSPGGTMPSENVEPEELGKEATS